MTRSNKLREIRKWTMALVMCLVTGTAAAQEDTVSTPLHSETVLAVRPVTNVLAVQMGSGKVRDTYLTPLIYEGTSIGVQYERWRVMRRQKLTNQQQVGLGFTTGKDKEKNSETWAARLRYRYAVHLKLKTFDHRTDGRPASTLLAGGYAGMDIGVNYNLKLAGSNTPMTVRNTEDLGLSAMATTYYRIRKWYAPVQLQWQMPIIGTALVPEFGESYYEAFYLNEDIGKHSFTSLHNRHDFDLRLTTDVPLYALFRRFLTHSDKTMRLGIAAHHEVMKVNDITTRHTTVEAVIGFVFQQIPFSQKRNDVVGGNKVITAF